MTHFSEQHMITGVDLTNACSHYASYSSTHGLLSPAYTSDYLFSILVVCCISWKTRLGGTWLTVGRRLLVHLCTSVLHSSLANVPSAPASAWEISSHAILSVQSSISQFAPASSQGSVNSIGLRRSTVKSPNNTWHSRTSKFPCT